MDMQFEHIFARDGFGSGEAEDQGFGIEDLCATRLGGVFLGHICVEVEDCILFWRRVKGSDGGVTGFGEGFRGTKGLVYLEVVV